LASNESYAEWPPTVSDVDLDREFAIGQTNRDVGTSLLFENDSVRVWEVELAPGERAPVHCHSTDYFWTCVDAGRARQHSFDSETGVRTIRAIDYARGQTTFFQYCESRYTLHDLENVGDGPIRFVTVELKSGHESSGRA
jgi:oxalate decarboxylase/phosphoglucose isomerase-like protein (cupin superfamily)